MLSCCYQLSDWFCFHLYCRVCVVVTLSNFSLSLSLSLISDMYPSLLLTFFSLLSLSFPSPFLLLYLPSLHSLLFLFLSPFPSLSLSPKGHTQVNWWGDGPQTEQVTQQQQADAGRDTTTQPSLSPKHTGVRCKKKYHIQYTVHTHAHVLWYVILRV